MILSDASIRQLVERKEIGFSPAPQDDAYQPASVDVRLGTNFKRLILGGHFEQDYLENDELYLNSGECVLACTAETISIPDYLVAKVEGKSTWGRKFLLIHSTAGFLDPGFHGQVTLELTNLSPSLLLLKVGEPIAQISFSYLDAPARRPYGSDGLGSRYQGQQGATLPKERLC